MAAAPDAQPGIGTQAGEGDEKVVNPLGGHVGSYVAEDEIAVLTPLTLATLETLEVEAVVEVNGAVCGEVKFIKEPPAQLTGRRNEEVNLRAKPPDVLHTVMDPVSVIERVFGLAVRVA